MYESLLTLTTPFNERVLQKDYHCNILTLRRLMSYIYGAPILDVSR